MLLAYCHSWLFLLSSDYHVFHWISCKKVHFFSSSAKPCRESMYWDFHYPSIYITGPLWGNPLVTSWFHHKGAVMWSFDILFYVCLPNCTNSLVLVIGDAMTLIWHHCNNHTLGIPCHYYTVTKSPPGTKHNYGIIFLRKIFVSFCQNVKMIKKDK